MKTNRAAPTIRKTATRIVSSDSDDRQHLQEEERQEEIAANGAMVAVGLGASRETARTQLGTTIAPATAAAARRIRANAPDAKKTGHSASDCWKNHPHKRPQWRKDRDTRNEVAGIAVHGRGTCVRGNLQ